MQVAAINYSINYTIIIIATILAEFKGPPYIGYTVYILHCGPLSSLLTERN